MVNVQLINIRLMVESEIKTLISKCTDYLSARGYTHNRIKEFQRLWTSGIVKFMSDININVYTTEVGEDFEGKLIINEPSKHVLKEKLLSIRVLNDMLLTGEIQKRKWHYVHYELKGFLTEEIEKFLYHLKELRRSSKTLGDYRRILSGFQKHLQERGIDQIEDINEIAITSFVDAYPSNKAQVFQSIKTLFLYWIDERIIDFMWVEFFKLYKVKQKERVCSFYSIDEVRILEQSVQRHSSVGKRNYAILLLASRLGMRAHDIADLKFSNIDWENNQITIITQKTGRKVDLPLLADVGNAIIEYLRYGRKKSGEATIFLSCHPPFERLCATTIGCIISKLICKSGIDISGRHHGSHCLRHSLATAMLADGSTIPIISETLAHKSCQSTMSYIKVDIQTMRKCSLPIPAVPEDFYIQKGEYFYD